jgi:hypothetical protein
LKALDALQIVGIPENGEVAMHAARSLRRRLCIRSS